MATKEAALQSFFEEFGLDVYAASAVPDDVTFPWLTYDLVTSAWDGNEGGETVSITVNLWYHTTSEAEPNAKVREISQAIGWRKDIECDEGYIRLYRGSPWCQSLTDDTDKQIKRRYINITATYDTFY